MYLKDYYGILELEPSATQQEIKKAFRKLALRYHPDKNNNDPYSTIQFSEIKEAYEVLTNPAKKEYYLQQRWYNQSIGKRKTQGVITPVTVLKQSLELEKYVSTLDAFRMDKEGLRQYILGLLSDQTIEELAKFNEPETIQQIVLAILKSMTSLPFTFTESIIAQLGKLCGTDITLQQKLTSFFEKNKRKNQREKYSLLAIIIATVILCLLIFVAGR